MRGQKYPKVHAGTFGQHFVRKIFLKLSHGAIRKLIARAPKIAHQQREMICAILRQFLQKLFLQTVIPHFTAYLSCVKLCATELQFDFEHNRDVPFFYTLKFNTLSKYVISGTSPFTRPRSRVQIPSPRPI